ncbi:hypothetical protein C0J45_16277 [Silurus meridionalis]|nr:hypothetical protein C0J45_16277 [Silurus meridionalis]
MNREQEEEEEEKGEGEEAMEDACGDIEVAFVQEDGRDYRCNTESEHRDIRFTVEGCTLNHETVDVTGYVGHSVLLPCSCSQLQAKPQTFTWTIYKGGNHKEIFPKDQTNHYTHRVQLFNDHPPGNLSLLISHLTVEDGGFYRCDIINSVKDIKLTVREAPKRPSPSTTIIQTTAEPESLPYFPFAVVTVIFLHIIVAVVYCSTKKKASYNKSFKSLRACCRLEGNRTTTKEITAYTGDSVLLPCSCTDLHTKPQKFTWEKETYTWVQISPESEQYKDRFQLVNDHSSGNLSLLISHLTVEDGRDYRCNTESEYRESKENYPPNSRTCSCAFTTIVLSLCYLHNAPLLRLPRIIVGGWLI